MSIDELVTKYSRLRAASVYTCHAAIRGALTEQAEAFKGELQSYDGMVRELTKTVEDMQAAQSVPVVGEPDCYDAGLLGDFGGGNVEWWQDYIRAELARAHDFYASQWPATSISAELATLREKAARLEETVAEYDRRIIAVGGVAINSVSREYHDAEVARINAMYVMAVKGRQDFRDLYREQLAVNAQAKQERDELRKALQKACIGLAHASEANPLYQKNYEACEKALMAIAQGKGE